MKATNWDGFRIEGTGMTGGILCLKTFRKGNYMSNLTIVLVILVIYMVLMVLIGLQGRKHSSSMQDFLTAGKQGTLLLVTGSFMGSHIGNGIVVGGAEYGATYGIGGMWVWG